MSKHTPAPWEVRYFRTENPEYGFFVEAKNNNIPELGYGIEIMMDDFGDHNGYPFEQRLADAKLIAAAPELLEALKQIANTSSDAPEAMQVIAKQAIKKATYE